MVQFFWPSVLGALPSRLARVRALAAFVASFLRSRSLADEPVLSSTSEGGGDFSSEAPSDFIARRAELQLFEQVPTSSQQRSHFFLHVKGRLHTAQTLLGRFSFFTPRGIADGEDLDLASSTVTGTCLDANLTRKLRQMMKFDATAVVKRPRMRIKQATKKRRNNKGEN